MNLLSVSSYFKPLKLLVDMLSNVNTYKYLNFDMKECTRSTMNSLCYLYFGLVLVRETNLFRFASGINNK